MKMFDKCSEAKQVTSLVFIKFMLAMRCFCYQWKDTLQESENQMRQSLTV